MSAYNKHTVDRLTAHLRGTSLARVYSDALLRALIERFLDGYAGEAMRTPGCVLSAHFQAWHAGIAAYGQATINGDYRDPEPDTETYQPTEDMQAYYARVRAIAQQD